MLKFKCAALEVQQRINGCGIQSDHNHTIRDPRTNDWRRRALALPFPIHFSPMDTRFRISPSTPE